MKLEYRIIEASNIVTLEERVTALLVNGWELQGGVCSYRDRNNWTIYSQAVAK